MHYVRLLRSPKLEGTKRFQIELLFTITTDLGDSFLYLDDPLKLTIEAHGRFPDGETSWPLSRQGQLSWQPGMRVLKPKFDVPKTMQASIESGNEIYVSISATKNRSADGVRNILSASEAPGAEEEHGLVMPVWVRLGPRNTDIDVSTRRLFLDYDSTPFIEVEEEVGESIARHIWDAGVVALCAIAGVFTFPELSSSQHSCMGTMKSILSSEESLTILELGCGVGILGTGIGAILNQTDSDAARQCSILMTDLDEAETRARSNIARLQGKPEHAQLLYENLDWEDGRQGRFGPQVQASRWDLVMLSDCTYNVDMLPALVETLSAVHAANTTHDTPGEPRPTKVFLATKPRHASERALFALLKFHGWTTLDSQIVPLPVLGAEAESVELYLFEKV